MKISDKFHSEDIYKLKNTVLTGKTEDIKWRLKNINICLLYTSDAADE